MTGNKNMDSGIEPRRLWVMRVPVLSTIHIKRDTLEKLATAGEQSRVIGYEEGAFVMITPRSSWNPPPEIKRLVKWFRGNFPRQWWIRFDRDGDVIPGLPVYDW
jgi:hypothetical protein